MFVHDIASTITSAYVFLWRERLKFAWLALPAVLGLTVLSAMFHSSGLVIVPSSGGRTAEPGIVYQLILLVAAAQFAVAWHRHQLLADKLVRLRRAYFLGRIQLHYLILLLGLSLLTAPISIGAHSFSFYAAGIFIDLQSPWHQGLVWIISLPLQLPALLIVARFAMCFPATAINRRLTLQQSWQRTRGFGWRLSVLIVLAAGPAMLFSTVSLMLALQFAGMETVSGSALFLVLMLLCNTLLFFAAALLATILSMFYRMLVTEPEAVFSATAITERSPQSPALPHRASLGMGLWLLYALVTGIVFGGVAFTGGFFVYPIGNPSNLAPLMGFFVAPFGFLLGFLLGLVWNLRKLGPRKLAGGGVIGGVFILSLALLMTPYFIPGFIMRSILLDAQFIPPLLKKPLAPAGTLRIWAIDIPLEEQASYGDGLGHYVGGPVMGLYGSYTVNFHTADSLIEAYRQADARQQGPDILVARHYDSIVDLAREPGMRSRLAEVIGNFSYRGMARFAFIDLKGANAGLARKLALNDLSCRNQAPAESATPGLASELEERAMAFALAIVTEGAEQVEKYSSTGRMQLDHTVVDIPRPVRITSSRFCGAWGTENLAFTQVLINFESPQKLGHRRLIMALRKEADEWRILSVSESLHSWDSLKESANRFEQLMLNRQWDREVPQVAIPDEKYEFVPSLEARQRSGHLVWTPSPSRWVVAEVAEIACRSRDQLDSEHDDIQFTVRVRSPGKKPVNYVHASKACLNGWWPWKWRVWTVSGHSLVFSGEHAVPTPVEHEAVGPE